MKQLLLVILCLSLVLDAQAARVSCGTEFKVVVKNDGSVWAWGDNSRGQLGLGYSGGSVSSPAVVPGLQNVVSVAAGDSTAVALKSDGTVWQWGLNPGLTTFTPTPTLVTGIANVAQIDAGRSHVLAIRNDGSVWAWGSNSTGMLGDGTTIAKTSPVSVSNLNNIIAVAGGGQFSMALSATGSVYVWGSNLYGQSGNNVASSVNQLFPILVNSLSSIATISAGRDHCLASSTSGLVYAWGRSNQGQIGIGSTSLASVNVPTQIASLVAVSKVCAGANNSVAILNNNTTWGWGQNASGTLGLGDANLKVSPQRITTLDNALDFDTGANSSERFAHSIALTNNEMCWSWGENATGQRGFGPLGTVGPGPTRSSPMEVTSLNNIRFLAAYTDSSMAIDQAANVISWGSVNGGPQLKTEVFPQIANLKKFVTGVQGPRCFLLNDQSLWTWGGAALGMLGTGEPLTNAAAPIAVPGMTNITDVSVGNNHVIALKQNGDIWTWGYNFSGVLGSLGIGSSQFYHASPVLITGVNQVKKIAAGSTHSLVLKQDGTLWAWGKNTTRALGDGTSINRTTPVLSHTIPNVQEIAVGSDISLALKTDGTVWTWGSTAQPAPPTQVPGLTGIVKIGARLNCRYAITESGSLWVWGDNANGQLGDGTTTNRTQPVKVMDYVTSVDMSGTHTVVLKEDGNVVAFGSGASGQLAEGIIANGFLPLPLLSLGSVQPTVEMVNPSNSSQLNVAGTYNFQINQTSNLQTPLAKVSVYHERALLTVDETPPFNFVFEPWTWGKFQFNCQAIDTTGKYSTFTIGSPVTVLYDSDNDLLPDWWELKYWPSLLTENSLADTDGDGLSNFDEYKKSVSPINSDTDGDGLTDFQEITLGLNPLLADSDGDLWVDGTEISAGSSASLANVTPLSVNPHFLDSYVTLSTASFADVRTYNTWVYHYTVQAPFYQATFQRYLTIGGITMINDIVGQSGDGTGWPAPYSQFASNMEIDALFTPQFYSPLSFNNGTVQGLPIASENSFQPLSSYSSVVDAAAFTTHRVLTSVALSTPQPIPVSISREFYAAVYEGFEIESGFQTEPALIQIANLHLNLDAYSRIGGKTSFGLAAPEGMNYNAQGRVDIMTPVQYESFKTHLPMESAPEVLAVNTNFDEGDVDEVTGAAKPDCANGSLKAKKNHLDGKWQQGDIVTSDLHRGFFGLRPGALPYAETAGAVVKIKKLDRNDPETDRKQSGHVRLYAVWGSQGNESEMKIELYDKETLVAYDIGPQLYHQNPSIPFTFYLEGVEPGKITLEFSYQKGSTSFRHEQEFLVATKKTRAQWREEVVYQIRLQESSFSTPNPYSDITKINTALGYRHPNPANDNSRLIALMYYYYAQLFDENQEKFLWPGMAKVAATSIYAGMSDMYLWNTNFITGGEPGAVGFVNDFMIPGAQAIFNDLAWVHHAYAASGIYAIKHLDDTEGGSVNLPAWQMLDEGIANNNMAKIRDAGGALLDREQNIVIQPYYAATGPVKFKPPGVNYLWAFWLGGVEVTRDADGKCEIGEWMSANSVHNPIPGPNLIPAGSDYGPLSFRSVVPGGRLDNKDHRWAWITHAEHGMLPRWSGTSTGAGNYSPAMRLDAVDDILHDAALIYSQTGGAGLPSW